MGQKLFTDKIGTLQHSAGNIQMIASLSNPAYLTIGGQQYKITSTLVVALPAMSANTRYQVYAVQSGGVVSLVISQNENSVGPAGYTRWKLVGSLYSNGASSVAFGAFIDDINGLPTTDWILGGAHVFTANAGSAPTIGNGGNPPTNRYFWRIRGAQVETYSEFAQNVAGAAGGPSGNYLVNVPFAINTVIHQVNTDGFSGINGTWNGYSKVGEGQLTSTTSDGALLIQPFDANRVRFWVMHLVGNTAQSTGGWGSDYFAFSNSDLEFSFNLNYQSSALTSKPIKDR